jgi:hypothetical protein
MEFDKVYTRTLKCKINIYTRFIWNVLKARIHALKGKLLNTLKSYKRVQGVYTTKNT